MDIVTIETLPPEVSMSGKNTCYLQCPALNRRSNYGVCLFTINAYNKGKLNEGSDCHQHVGRGYCEALSYQRQEQEAGRALFYLPRGEQIDVVVDTKPSVVTEPTKPESDSYMRGWNQVSDREKGKKPAKKAAVKKPKKSVIFGTDKSELSDAVTEVAKEEAKKKKTRTPRKASTVTSGMSILERARLMAGGA
ncbi:hypothetical protein JCM19235_1370 [Vibrio maritimus]|uniref:Uncharacterized protein n=1 Tax=Vibrio maritimus TaxID=990268 RepID=A0A090S994_9VIBR|nr:hypothetical protein JCM19235_1370 [Vibrio maritimus]